MDFVVPKKLSQGCEIEPTYLGTMDHERPISWNESTFFANDTSRITHSPSVLGAFLKLDGKKQVSGQSISQESGKIEAMSMPSNEKK
jgi:hypothetical protein